MFKKLIQFFKESLKGEQIQTPRKRNISLKQEIMANRYRKSKNVKR